MRLGGGTVSPPSHLLQKAIKKEGGGGVRDGLCTFFFYQQPWNLSLLYMCVVCLCGRVPSGEGELRGEGGED